MRAASVGLAARLGKEVISFARLWKIVLADATRITFTDHDQNIVYGGDTYSSFEGFDASSVLSAVGSTIQGVEINRAIDASITEEMVRSNALDGAVVTLSVIDWQHPSDGVIDLFGGTTGDVYFSDKGNLKITIDGQFRKDRFILIESYSTTCRVDLGSPRCGVDIDALSTTFTVDVVAFSNKFTTLELNQADAAWNYGLIRFTSGANNGLVFEVAKTLQSDKSVFTYLPIPFLVVPGDTGTIWPGCDKQLITGCLNKYNNVINFQGEPYNPSSDIFFS